MIPILGVSCAIRRRRRNSATAASFVIDICLCTLHVGQRGNVSQYGQECNYAMQHIFMRGVSDKCGGCSQWCCIIVAVCFHQHKVHSVCTKHSCRRASYTQHQYCQAVFVNIATFFTASPTVQCNLVSSKCGRIIDSRLAVQRILVAARCSCIMVGGVVWRADWSRSMHQGALHPSALQCFLPGVQRSAS